MNIGEAVGMMWKGNKVARAGWNGKNQYVAIQLPNRHRKVAGDDMTQPYVYIHTVQGDHVPWLCSQADLLATDWEIIGDEIGVLPTTYANLVKEQKEKSNFVAGVQIDTEENKSF